MFLLSWWMVWLYLALWYGVFRFLGGEFGELFKRYKARKFEQSTATVESIMTDKAGFAAKLTVQYAYEVRSDIKIGEKKIVCISDAATAAVRDAFPIRGRVPLLIDPNHPDRSFLPGDIDVTEKLP